MRSVARASSFLGLIWLAAKILAGLALLALVMWTFGWAAFSSAHARERYAGQFDDIDPSTRAWFKSVKSKHGVPCCDIADGHKTSFKTDKDGHFYVPINVSDPEDPWILVPPEAVVYDAGNPYEEAVVWYVMNGPGVFYIRCFVPSGGV